MVELLDETLEKLDSTRYVLVVCITKKGGVTINGAGFSSELELEGLKATIPALIDDVICNTFCEDEE